MLLHAQPLHFCNTGVEKKKEEKKSNSRYSHMMPDFIPLYTFYFLLQAT